MGTKTYDNANDLITFSRASGGTYLDSDGLLKTASTNIPRIEYDTAGVVKGLLIEEARTNWVTYSEDFSNAFWPKSDVSVVASSVTDPAGGTGAYELIESATTANHLLNKAGLVGTTSATYTNTIFAKANTRSWIRVQNQSPSSSWVNVNLTNGEIGLTGGGEDTYSVTNFGNGWYRISLTSTPVSQGNGPQIFVLDSDKGGASPSYTGNGTSSILIYGAQFEAGSFPTSYIPTSGATATRAADLASIPVADFGYNQDQGTVVVEAETSSTAQSNHADLRIKSSNSGFAVTDSGSRVGNFAAGSYAVYAPSTTVLMNIGSVITEKQPYKAAYTLKENDAALSVGGSLATTDTTTSFSAYPANLFELGKGGNYLNGHIKSIQYYPRRLTNTQLQELTT